MHTRAAASIANLLLFSTRLHRQHLSCDDWLEDKGEDDRYCSVLYRVLLVQLLTITSTLIETVPTSELGKPARLDLDF